MPPTRNPFLEANFSKRPSSASGKYHIFGCNHCKWAETSPRRALEYLGPGYKPPESSVQPAKRPQTLQLRVQSILQAKKQRL